MVNEGYYSSQAGAGPYAKDGEYVGIGSLVTNGFITDTNGNQLTATRPNTNTVFTFTDIAGRTLPNDGSYYDSAGVLRQLQVTTISVPYNMASTTPTNQFGYGTCSNCTGTFQLVHTITLPNGMTYTIDYVPNSFAQPSDIILPTGGKISLTWSGNDMGGPVLQSRSYTDGNGHTSTWTYNNLYGQVQSVTDPLGNDTVVSRTCNGTHCYIAQMDYYAGSSTSGTLLKRVKTDYAQVSDPASSDPGTAGVPLMPIRTTTYYPAGGTLTLFSEVETDWEKVNLVIGNDNSATTANVTWGNPAERREYNVSPGSGQWAVTRRTTFTYLHTTTGGAYLANNIADRLVAKTVYNGSGTMVAKTTTSYDGSAVASTGTCSPATGAPNHDYCNFGSTYTTRGNPTQVSRWLNPTGTWLNTTNVFNDLGNLTSSTDPGGHTTTFSYADNFTDGINRNTQAFVTQVTSPVTNGVNHISRKQYFWNTSLLAASCGENFPATSACTNTLSPPQSDYATYSYDLMNRLLLVKNGGGGQTAYTYNDVAPVSVASTSSITPTLNLMSTSVRDDFGRLKQTQLNSDPDGPNPVYSDITYDDVGRKASTSNPYRSTSDPTYGITNYQYDAIGRTTKLIPPDGTTSSNNVITSYGFFDDAPASSAFYCTQVTDQAGKTRTSCNDPMGRMTQVFEDPASLDYETDYTYDTLDNLLTVTQKGGSTNSANWRPRTFTYDSLSRLLTSSNPETGTVSYTYDADGNMLTKTSPAPNQTGSATVTTTYTYDALHRLTQKSFSDSTPAVKYGYDGVAPSGCTPPALTITNGIGRRTSMCDAGGAEAWSYDVMGRTSAESRKTNGITKNTSYTYNLDGSMASLTYPSGRTVAYSYSSAARPVSAVDTANGINYATGAAYAPPGGLSAVTLGYSSGFAGINLSDTYNTRLQPNELKAWSTAGTAFDLSYSFVDSSGHNNGNVIQIVNNLNGNRTQQFTYDVLNRLLTAQTPSGCTSGCWSQSFTYDAWANLLQTTATGIAPPMGPLAAGTNNRLTSAGFNFDSAGNETTDVTNSYAWNAEGEIKTANGVNYTHDGDGNRVEKANGKIYWYGAGSEILDESDLSGNITDEYAFFGGKRIAHRDASGNLYYYAEDMLGSSRVITTSVGVVCYDADFYPFGGERTVTSTCSQNYKFEGKERDAETGNDDFGARYYSSVYGRWLSADWSAVPVPVPYANLTNPQTLNLYAMVRDNPETFADLDGHEGDANGQADGGTVKNTVSPAPPPPAYDVSSTKAVYTNQIQTAVTQAGQTAVNDKKLAEQQDTTNKMEGAVVYSEKTTATPDEAKALVSVIENRASSGDKQYVDKGKDVNVENVINHADAFQGVGGKNYQAFMNGKATGAGATNASSAVTDVHKNGTTTDATFFLVNPGGQAPTARQVRALGNVQAATPDHVGDVYLYKPKGN